MTVDPVETQYFVHENASPRRVEITRPDGVKTVMLSHNAPGQWNDGLIFQDETYNPNPQERLARKVFCAMGAGRMPAAGADGGAIRVLRAAAVARRNHR